MKKLLKRTLALISVCVLATPMAIIAACNGNGGAGNSAEEMPAMPTQVELPEVAIESASAKIEEMLEKYNASKNCSFNYIVHVDELYKSFDKDGVTLAESSDYEYTNDVAYKYLETDKPYGKCVFNGDKKRQFYRKAIPEDGREELNESMKSKANMTSYLCGDALSVVNSFDRNENGITRKEPVKLLSYSKRDWEYDEFGAKYWANSANGYYREGTYSRAIFSARNDIEDYLHYLDLKSKNQPYMPIEPAEYEEDYKYDMKKYTCTVKADETKLYFEWERVYIVNSTTEVSAYEKIYFDNAAGYSESDFTTDLISDESVKDVCYIDVDRDALKADLLANKEIAIDIKGGGDINKFSAAYSLSKNGLYGDELKIEGDKLIIPANTISSLRAKLGIKESEPINDVLTIVFDNYDNEDDIYTRATYIKIPF